MSVVVVRVHKNGYDMAADSIGVYGYTQTKSDRGTFSKMAEVNEIVIGGVGWAEEISLFYLYSETRKPADATEMGILNFIGEFSEWKYKKIGKYFGGNDYFIGYGGKVFGICGWQVEEILTHGAIGAGMDYALAALYLGHSVEKAVEVATELSVYCEAPIVVIRKTTGGLKDVL